MAQGTGGENVELCLDTIEIEFTDRPRHKLKVEVDIGNESHSHELLKETQCAWRPNFNRLSASNCKLPLDIDIHICKKNSFAKGLFGKYELYARITKHLTGLDEATTELNDGSQVRVKLNFSGKSVSSSSDACIKSDPPAGHDETGGDLSSSLHALTVSGGLLQQNNAAIENQTTVSLQSGDNSNTLVQIPELRQRFNVDLKIIKQQQKAAVLERLGKVRGPLDLLRTVGGAVAELNPYAKLAFTAVDSLYRICEKQAECCAAAVELGDQLDFFLSLISKVPELEKRDLSRRAISVMLHLIKDVSDYFCENAEKGTLANLLGTQRHQEKLENFKKEFNMARMQFDSNVQVESMRMLFDLLQRNIVDAQQNTLRNLRDDRYLMFMKEATYDPNIKCLKDTRTRILKTLVQWGSGKSEDELKSLDIGENGSKVTEEANLARDGAVLEDLLSENMVWLVGMAGSGKSTVANTLAALLKDQGCNVLSFFCKRDKQNDWSSVGRVLLMLAYQTAESNPTYADKIMEILRGPRKDDLLKGVLSSQVEELFTKALPHTNISSSPHVIVIDALDECAGSQLDIVKALATIVSAVPWIKVLLTSRFSRDTDDYLRQKPDLCRVVDINSVGQIETDLRVYTESKLRALQEELERDDDKESFEDEQITVYTERLAKKAGNLFAWSSTVFRYLEKSADPVQDIERLLSADDRDSIAEPLHALYALYDNVLEAAPHNNSGDVKLMQSILEIVFVTASTTPLPTRAIAAILGKNPEKDRSVRRIVRSLRAVLYEDEKDGGVVRVYHLSLLDFVGGKMGYGNWATLEATHERMFRSGMALMRDKLKFNICRLEDASRLNKEVEDMKERISQHVAPGLDYSCRCWMTHLLNSGLSASEAQGTVDELLCSMRVLFWMEVLSITGSVERSIPILRQCSVFFKGVERMVQASEDFIRFVSFSFQTMDSTPHIYLSAVPWTPINTCIRKIVREKFQHLSLISSKLPESWDATSWILRFDERVEAVAYSPDGLLIAVAAGNDVHLLDATTGQATREPLEGHSDKVKSIAFSGDSKRIASGSQDRTLRIWDMVTGRAVGEPLRGHDACVRCVAYSKDGSLVVSGSGDKTIRLWNARSGQPIGGAWQGHSASVFSIAISPDNKRVVSGSYDDMLRIWNTDTGESVGKALEGHSSTVTSVVISPDGTRIASGSWDKTLRLWNLKTGELIGEPLRGHSGDVNCVDFSPDGRRIVTGADDRTIQIWDARTGNAEGAPMRGHTGWVSSATFSPDGAHILSGSNDGTVHIWSLGTSGESESQQAHSGSVNSVVFTPDGARVISGSDDGTVRIWDARNGEGTGAPLRGHSGVVRSVAVSPDGTRVASGSDDKTVCIWDTKTGEAVGKPLEGHSEEVNSVAYSHDGTRIVSGSGDKTVRIWSSSTAESIGDPLRGHEGAVRSVAFSLDNTRIASGSHDETIQIWDMQTGTQLGEPLRGYTGYVLSVAFSPDGKRIASGSVDATIRLWDPVTGKAIGEPLRGHSDSVHSVAFSADGLRIVSGSFDRTIRIWDVNTGKPIGEPLRCHSDCVKSIAFSPDGSRIVSGSGDGNIFISTVRDADRESWNQKCRKMVVTDGWVKDGDKLLLWIPDRYRRRFKDVAEIGIGEHIQERVLPRVDLEVLERYSGARWTDIYKGDM